MAQQHCVTITQNTYALAPFQHSTSDSDRAKVKAYRSRTSYNIWLQIHALRVVFHMKKQNTKTQTVRIIGGRWRGRKISFPEINDLRPTLGRTRETLFNWLRPEIDGTRCLDLFAGSGALGIEALSQGAGEVLLVENEPTIFRALEKSVTDLGEPTCRAIKANGLAYLTALHGPFDIIFLDPPYTQPELLGTCLELIAQRKLAKNYIYVESNQGELIEELCSINGFEIDRRTSSGSTFSALVAGK